MSTIQPKIDRVAIIGGTHGNESIGVYLIKKFQWFPDCIRRSSFETLTLLANPKAVEARTRYIDTDLNRCFNIQDLNNPNLVQYEQILAKKIYSQMKSDRIDFLVDIHTTTANMGLTLLLDNDSPFNLRLSAYLVSRNKKIKLVQTESNRDKNRLRNSCNFGFTIEVGAVAQGVLDATLFQETESLVFDILDYLEKYNRQDNIVYPEEIELYSYCQTVHYPRNEEGEVTGMIHPDLQGRDYCPLKEGAPILLKFDGRAIYYEGENIVYPVFINEAAYWEKDIAMSLTTKNQRKIASDR